MYNKTVLDNGIKIVSEEINHVRSVSIGAWVLSGSRHENEETHGTAHFIEHMLFKGTKRRTATDIAVEIDSVGGMMNAFTGKELTSFHIKVPDYHLSLAIDLLADILQNSLFDVEEIEKERSVVIQEINMIEDSPDDYIHDYFDSVFWNGHPLGLSVLGTKDRISRLNREGLLSFFEERYRGDNLVIAAAGHLKHDNIVDIINGAFGSLKKQTVNKTIELPRISSRRSVLEKELEQVHMLIGTIAPSATNPKRYASYILNAVLGGSMSSRLFQEIREKRGLAYAINSFIAPYIDTGLLCIYAGVDPERVGIVIGLISETLKRLSNDLLTEKELRAAKELIKGNFILSMENTETRMTKLAKNEICFGQYIPSEDVLSRIESVECSQVRDLACEMFDPEIISVVATGKTSENYLNIDLFKR